MDFEPRRWQPPADVGLVGPFAVNEDLRPAALWDTTGVGPEDVAIDSAGRAVTGLRDGRIVRFDVTGGRPETIADVGGRPLGIEPAADGDGFVIANADLGLQRLTADGRVEVLANRHRDREFMLTNNAAVARDGTTFFSVSSHRWPLSEYTADILERSATGTLYRLDTNGELDVLVDGLVFANGVALSADESFVLVAELGSYRIHRVWLDGDRAGHTEIFCDNLPGFPDNLNLGNGLFWCAFPRTRDRLLDATLTRPRVRSIIHRLPPRLQPQPSRHGFVVAFDDRGAVHANFQDPTGRVALTTTAIAHGRYLYVGSPSEPTLAVLTLPDRLAR
ncbi:MAG TPA: SMP-30/gluconolactonase/LRE family protein [Acidimicrobiia bacterium]|nr:SMP-30/gluconolactonase/LRE family protein [Acidimicrobiia bacterium]